MVTLAKEKCSEPVLETFVTTSRQEENNVPCVRNFNTCIINSEELGCHAECGYREMTLADPDPVASTRPS